MRKLSFQLENWKRRSCRPGAPLEAEGGRSSSGRFVSLSSSGGPPCLRSPLPTLGIFCPWGLPPTQPTRALMWVRKPANLELPCSCPGAGVHRVACRRVGFLGTDTVPTHLCSLPSFLEGQAAACSPRLSVLPLPGLHQPSKLLRTVLQDALSPELLTEPLQGRGRSWWASYARPPSFYLAHGLSSLLGEVSPQCRPEPRSHGYSQGGRSLLSGHSTHCDPSLSKDWWTS